ncbi:MAG: hypothetical protein ACU84J_02515 [Gammaproteobacteria bacterium]
MKVSKIFLLLGGAQLLIVIAGGFLLLGLLEETPETFDERSSADASVAQFEPVALDIQALTEQPLFQPSRRPYTAPPAETELQTVSAAETPIDPPTLTGIMSSFGAPRALLENSAQKTAGLIGPGERFDGWTVRSVEEQKVVLSRPHRDDVTLTLNPEPLPRLVMDSR